MRFGKFGWSASAYRCLRLMPSIAAASLGLTSVWLDRARALCSAAASVLFGSEEAISNPLCLAPETFEMYRDASDASITTSRDFALCHLQCRVLWPSCRKRWSVPSSGGWYSLRLRASCVFPLTSARCNSRHYMLRRHPLAILDVVDG